MKPEIIHTKENLIQTEVNTVADESLIPNQADALIPDTADGEMASVVQEIITPDTDLSLTKLKLTNAIIHIFAKKNNTFITVTDKTGAEKIFTHSGGLIAKSGRDKSGQKTGLQGWQNMIEDLTTKGITSAIIKFRNVGGVYSKLKTLALKTILKNVEVNSDVKIESILNVTPDAHGMIRKKGGRRGRRV